jgi:hypothetical protein
MNKNKIIHKIEDIQLKIISKKKRVSKINKNIISYNCILVANISKDKKDIQENLYQLKKEKKNLNKQINYLKYKFKKNIKLLNTESIINNIQSESSNSSSDSDIDTFITKKNNNYNNYCQDISSSENSLDSLSDESEIEEKIDNSGNICEEKTPLVNTNSCNEIGQETSITNSYNEPELNCSSTENITMNIVKQSEEQGELQSLKIELEKVIMDENKQNLVENYDSDDSDDSDDIRSLKQIISSL